jgi:hypothetical protein
VVTEAVVTEAVVTGVAGLLEDFTAEAGITAGAGLLTVEAVAGMAVPTAAWPTWVMGGVAMQ